MSDVVITAENLGKKYVIGHAAATEPYDASVDLSTDADPNVITSPQPPADLRTW